MSTHRQANAIPILVTALLFGVATHASAQGRGAQTASTPTATTPAPQAPAASALGRGRAGLAGPGPAVGGDVDETPVVTHHSVTVDGKTLNYTATVAQMPLKDASGETEAHIFYMAYTLDGAEAHKRPLTFCFNGGPGSASMWVHIGGRVRAVPSFCPMVICHRLLIS